MRPVEARAVVDRRYPRPIDDAWMLTQAARAADELRFWTFASWCGLCQEGDHDNHRAWHESWGGRPPDFVEGGCVSYENLSQTTCRCPWREPRG